MGEFLFTLVRELKWVRVRLLGRGGGRGVDCELSVLNIYMESEMDVGICNVVKSRCGLNHYSSFFTLNFTLFFLLITSSTTCI